MKLSVCHGQLALMDGKVSHTVRIRLTDLAKEDVVILGKRVPKGTLVVFSTVMGNEDRSTPVYAAPDSPTSLSSISSAESSDSESAIHLSDSLKTARGDVPPRKVGYWASGTGGIFDPERWLNENGLFDISMGPSLPFSTGQRGCFGKNLAVRIGYQAARGVD